MKKISSYLIFYNFKTSSVDHSLFIKHDLTYITIVLVYMDDIIIIGNNSTQIRELKGKLKENFDIKGLDFLKYFFKSLDSIFT
jgi:Reverse transcriptase (RNA-dependent DNA polymerase)